jgi:hypothetical protein
MCGNFDPTPGEADVNAPHRLGLTAGLHAELLDTRLDDDEFQLENLRDQLDRALMYPDEEFAEYGCDPVQSAQIRAWAQTWAARLNMEIAEAGQWSDGE